MRISDWSSDVCSSDLNGEDGPSLESTSYTVAQEIFRARKMPRRAEPQRHHHQCHHRALGPEPGRTVPPLSEPGRDRAGGGVLGGRAPDGAGDTAIIPSGPPSASRTAPGGTVSRSEAHTSALQSLMRI